MNWFKQLFGTKSNGEAEPEGSDSVPKAATARRREPIPTELATRKAPNLVDGINALATYYRYLEAEAYDRGLKTMREHRDFRDEFLNRANAVLLYEQDSDARDQIALAIARETEAFALAPAIWSLATQPPRRGPETLRATRFLTSHRPSRSRILKAHTAGPRWLIIQTSAATTRRCGRSTTPTSCSRL